MHRIIRDTRPARGFALTGTALVLVLGSACSDKATGGGNADAGESGASAAASGSGGLPASTGGTTGASGAGVSGFSGASGAAVSGFSGAGGAGDGGIAGGSGAGTTNGGPGGSGATGGTGGVIAGASGTAGGAGTNEGGAMGNGVDCVDDEGIICAPRGFPFTVKAARSCGDAGSIPTNCDTAAATGILGQPEAGRLCLSGTSTSWALMSLVFEALDADALGIAQVAFTIDSPTNTKLRVSAGGPGPVYDFVTESGQIPPGPQTLSLAAFELDGMPLDTSAVNVLGFFASQGAYDFCIRDLKFLDADGQQVAEPD